MTDLERKREIQRRTLVGLEEDLDDLRDELADALQDYEGRLQDVSDALPDWLAVDPARVRQQFSYDDPTVGRGRLGPRAVAMGAARVETFIHEWIGRSGEIHEVDYENDASEFEAAHSEVSQWLSRLEDLSRELALDADTTFGQWLDDILTELEDKREDDSVALRELVGSGDVGKGGGAREEIAALFEEQRLRAAQLRASWGEIEALVFEGVDVTVEGVAELSQLLGRALEGLSGVRPAKSDEEDESADKDIEIDDIPDTQVDNQIDEAPGPPGVTIDSVRHTEPLDVPHVTSPFLRQPKRNKKVTLAEPEAESEPGLEVDEPLEETAKIDLPDYEADIEDSAQDASEADEVQEDEAIEESEVEEVAPDLPEESDVEDSEAEEAEDEAEPAEDAPEEELESRSDDHDDAETSYSGEAKRIVTTWVPITPLEKGIVLGWPLLLALVITPPSLIKLTGRVSVFDPLADLPWIFPWVFWVACAWVFIGAAMRHWRPVFDGLKMGLVRWSETRETTDVRVSDGALRLGTVRLGWSHLTSEVTRWESRADGTFGWMLDIRPRGSAPIIIVAPERNFSYWDQSSLGVTEVPDDAWQVSPVVLTKLRDHL